MTAKTMSASDLRDEGFLSEANRIFFHPLGLALGVDLENDEIIVYDYREDMEGVVYDLSDPEFRNEIMRKHLNVNDERRLHARARLEKFGWVTQPVPHGGRNRDAG